MQTFLITAITQTSRKYDDYSSLTSFQQIFADELFFFTHTKYIALTGGDCVIVKYLDMN